MKPDFSTLTSQAVFLKNKIKPGLFKNYHEFSQCLLNEELKENLKALERLLEDLNLVKQKIKSFLAILSIFPPLCYPTLLNKVPHDKKLISQLIKKLSSLNTEQKQGLAIAIYEYNKKNKPHALLFDRLLEVNQACDSEFLKIILACHLQELPPLANLNTEDLTAIFTLFKSNPMAIKILLAYLPQERRLELFTRNLNRTHDLAPQTLLQYSVQYTRPVFLILMQALTPEEQIIALELKNSSGRCVFDIAVHENPNALTSIRESLTEIQQENFFKKAITLDHLLQLLEKGNSQATKGLLLFLPQDERFDFFFAKPQSATMLVKLFNRAWFQHIKNIIESFPENSRLSIFTQVTEEGLSILDTLLQRSQGCEKLRIIISKYFFIDNALKILSMSSPTSGLSVLHTLLAKIAEALPTVPSSQILIQAAKDLDTWLELTPINQRLDLFLMIDQRGFCLLDYIETNPRYLPLIFSLKSIPLEAIKVWLNQRWRQKYTRKIHGLEQVKNLKTAMADPEQFRTKLEAYPQDKRLEVLTQKLDSEESILAEASNNSFILTVIFESLTQEQHEILLTQALELLQTQGYNQQNSLEPKALIFLILDLMIELGLNQEHIQTLKKPDVMERSILSYLLHKALKEPCYFEALLIHIPAEIIIDAFFQDDIDGNSTLSKLTCQPKPLIRQFLNLLEKLNLLAFLLRKSLDLCFDFDVEGHKEASFTTLIQTLSPEQRRLISENDYALLEKARESNPTCWKIFFQTLDPEEKLQALRSKESQSSAQPLNRKRVYGFFDDLADVEPPPFKRAKGSAEERFPSPINSP